MTKQTIDRDLIVPFRRHTLRECDEIIRRAVGADRSVTTYSMDNVHKERIDACLNESSKRLTRWEEDFLISIQDQLTIKGSLSDRQAEILERIYVEKV